MHVRGAASADGGSLSLAVQLELGVPKLGQPRYRRSEARTVFRRISLLGLVA